MMDLPTRLYKAEKVYINNLSSITFDIDLNFGVHVKKDIRIEGIEQNRIPRRLRNDAKRCLLVLLSGKRVLIHCNDTAQDEPTIGRVYLTCKIHGQPKGMYTPFEMDKPLLEVGTFFMSLLDREFDINVVKAVLNGTGGA